MNLWNVCSTSGWNCPVDPGERVPIQVTSLGCSGVLELLAGESIWQGKSPYSLHCPNFCSISGVIVKVQNQLVLLRLPFLWAVKYMDCPWEWDEQGHRLSLKRAFILLNLSSNTELYRLILSAISLSKLFVKTACRHSYWIIFLNK